LPASGGFVYSRDIPFAATGALKACVHSKLSQQTCMEGLAASVSPSAGEGEDALLASRRDGGAALPPIMAGRHFRSWRVHDFAAANA
jgi:hypothetical protein